jgi:hypothetical protein
MSFASIDPTNTQGPIREILVKIAQLLVVVEKLSFFESAILKHFFQKKFFFFASSLFKLVIIYRIPWMERNFEDYFDFQQKARGVYKIMSNTVGSKLGNQIYCFYM